MDLFIATVDLMKRQSGTDKLLDLLADPYRSAVSSFALAFTTASLTFQTALPIFHLCKFGHIDRLHLTPRPRILPPKTLQLRRIFTEIEDCR